MSYLLVRTPILDDESMSSWLHRLKIGNGLVDRRGLLQSSGRRASGSIDPDLLMHPEHHASLTDLTDVSMVRQRRDMLSKLEGYLVSSFSRGGRSRWLLRTGKASTNGNCGRYVICPQCLKETAAPYYRWYWRLAPYVFCHKHRTPMRD